MHNQAQRFSTCLLLPAPVSSIETRSATLHFSIVNGSFLIIYFIVLFICRQHQPQESLL